MEGAARGAWHRASPAVVQRALELAVLDGVTDAVLVVDAAGQPVLANAGFDELLRLGSTDLELLRVRAARGECLSDEMTIAAASGELQFDVTVKPVLGADGAVEGGIVVLTERTDRRRLHLHEEFMAIASHELRSPLTALGGFVDMVSRNMAAELDARSTEHMARARAQVRRLSDLIDELTDLARLERGKLSMKMARVDLVSLLGQTASTMQTLSATHEVRLKAPEAPVWVRGDPSRLEQVLMNLVGNAVKHAPDSDSIEVELGEVDGQALVRVRDYGHGIADGDRDQVFDRYYQAMRRERGAAQGGLGLGLHIAREIMLAHGGDVELTSTSPEGTIFTVRLPLATT